MCCCALEKEIQGVKSDLRMVRIKMTRKGAEKELQNLEEKLTERLQVLQTQHKEIHRVLAKR